MFKFFHQLFNPHCEHCRLERQEQKECSSCEILKAQLDRANEERQQLLNKLLKNDDEPVKAVQTETDIKPKLASVPFAVKRQMLEQESRERARTLRENAENIKEGIEKLEKEIGVK